VDIVTGLTPSSQVSPGPAQLQGSAALVTDAPTSNTAVSFNGTTGYMNLGTTSPTNFDYSTSNIFFEAWIYFNDLSTIQRIYQKDAFTFRYNSGNGKLGVYGGFGGPAENDTVFTTGQWYHIAFSSVPGASSYVFVNGSPGAGLQLGYTGYNSGTSVNIGTNGYNFFNGYIRDLRVVQGGVVPVATFTPGAAPFSYALPSYVTGSGSTVFTLLGQFITYNPSGKYGSAVSITNYPVNGSTATSYIRYPLATPINVDNGFTTAFWFKTPKIPIASEGYPITINGSAGGFTVYFVYNSSSQMAFLLYDGGFRAPPAVSYTAGTWYHIAGTIRNGLISLYVNGALTGTGSYTPSGVTVNTQFYVGSAPGYGGADILMDDLRIYNTALTAAQIQSVYSSQGAPAPSRAMPLPKYAWDFNGTTTDYVSGLVPSFVWGNPTSYGTGKYLQDAVFNTTPGSATSGLRYDVSGQGLSSFTIAFWVKPLSTIPVASGNQRFLYFVDANSTNFFWMGFQATVTTPTIYGQNPTGGSPLQTIGFSVTPPAMTQGQWLHLTWTVAQNGQYSVYVNGVSYAVNPTTLYASQGVSGNPFSLANPLKFIDVATQGGNQAAFCEIDDLRIFDRALTSLQVQSIYNQQGMPGRGVQVKSPIQPGYVYAPLHNSTIIGTSSPWVVNSQNPDPTTSGITGTDNWNTDPNRTNLWSLAPFKYFIFLSRNAYPLNNIPVEGLIYPVLISVTGTYQLSLLVCTGGGNSDSLFWNFDNDAPVNQGGFSVPESFSTWYSFGNVTLTAGSHTLSLQMREPVGIGAIKLSSTIYPGTYYNVTPITLTGTPLFSQLSSGATSSAVGAFSLRAVNGGTAKAVQVRPVAAFPPAAMTGASTSLSGYIFGGSGTYVASASSTIGGFSPWRAFDKLNINDANEWAGVAGNYPSSTTYAGSNATTVSSTSYPGEWLQIQFPSFFLPTSITITSPWNAGSARTFAFAGSVDGTNWDLLINQTSATILNTNNTSQSFPITTNSTYKYFRLILSTAYTTYGQVGELVIFGSTDGSATDFYADRLGNLLTAPVTGQSLANWLRGATGYVTKWYDQSGRGNHMEQATASNQPTMNLSTTPVSITMTGVEYFQNTVPFTFNFGSGAFTLRYVVSNNTGGLVLYKASKSDFVWNSPYEKKFWLGDGTATEGSRGGYPSKVGNSENYVIGAAAIGSTKTSVVHKATSTTAIPIYVNGTLQTLARNDSTMGTDPGNFLYFGRGGSASNYIGNLHEIQIFSTALSDTDRLALEN
jgi:hypothetical protein